MFPLVSRPSRRLVHAIDLLTIALLLAISLAARDNEASSVNELKSITSDEIGQICNDKKVKIRSVSQMTQVINAARLIEGLCRKRYMASFNELEGILRLPREQLCSDESFELIRSYHFRFISPERHLNRRVTQFEPDPREVVRAQLHPDARVYSLQFDEYNQMLKIPRSVRNFWLAFALQLSAQCKRNLLDNLKSNVAKYLDEDDLAVMDVFNKDSPIGQIMADGLTMINFDNALYMPELEGEIKGKHAPSHQRVYMRTEASRNSSIYALISACQTRFKPIYQKLVMPVIKLVKLGYDYQGDQLTAEEQSELQGPEVKSWLGLVNVCETFERVIVIGPNEDKHSDPDEHSNQEVGIKEKVNGALEGVDSSEADSEEEENNKIETITDKEAEQLIAESMKGQNDEQSGSSSGSSSRGDLSLIEADRSFGEYKMTKLNRMEDEIWITSERQLDLELSKKVGNTNPFGFKGFLRRIGAKIKRTFAKLDPDRFAHYRHNSLWYAGIFNLISGITNSLSTGITAVFVMIILV